MASVAVIGVGAVGGFFAAHAAAAGHRVTLCVRRPFDRLVVESPGGRLDVDPPVLVDPADAAVADWVLLATKSHQTAAAAGWLEAVAGPHSVVAVLQNGVEHVERVAPLVRVADVLPTVVYCGAELVAPGRVVHRTSGFLIVPESAAGRGLSELFAGTGAEVRVTSDFAVELWRKLAINVAANALTAITGRRLREISAIEGVGDLAVSLMEECVDVARAEGAPLEDALPRAVVERWAGFPEDSGTSMLYDRLAGRPLEHDALNGAVVRIGARHGVGTPLNKAVLALLEAMSGHPLGGRAPQTERSPGSVAPR